MSENKRSILMRFLSGALPLLLVLYVNSNEFLLSIAVKYVEFWEDIF